jgi:hypothetical protein
MAKGVAAKAVAVKVPCGVPGIYTKAFPTGKAFETMWQLCI